MTRVKAWLPPDSIVTVPKVHKFDEENHVMILEDCGEDVLTLKEFLREGKASPDLADEIGTAIGQFIGSLHDWSRKNPHGVLDIFRRNEQAMTMSAWVTYGCLVSVLSGEEGLAALSDPQISISERDSAIIAKVASSMGAAMTSARDFVSDACIHIKTH